MSIRIFGAFGPSREYDPLPMNRSRSAIREPPETLIVPSARNTCEPWRMLPAEDTVSPNADGSLSIVMSGGTSGAEMSPVKHVWSPVPLITTRNRCVGLWTFV